MTLYEIESEIQNLVDTMVDPETGEIDDAVAEKLAALQIDRKTKLENMACALIGLKREKADIAEERKKLEKREKSVAKQIERLSGILQMALDGEKLKSPRVSVYYTHSEATEVDPEFIEWAQQHSPDLLSYSAPTANRTAIKDFIKSGNELIYARVVAKTSMVVK